MSAELFHVIAQIIRRHRNEHGTVPVCARYDLHEKVWSEELPYLFQSLHSGRPSDPARSTAISPPRNGMRSSPISSCGR
jgi:hypothetical protein